MSSSYYNDMYSCKDQSNTKSDFSIMGSSYLL